MGTTLEERPAADPRTGEHRSRARDPISLLLLMATVAFVGSGSAVVARGLSLLPEAHRQSQLSGADGVQWLWPAMILTVGGTSVLIGSAVAWWEAQRHTDRLARVLRGSSVAVLVALTGAAAFSMVVFSMGDRCWGSCG